MYFGCAECIEMGATMTMTTTTSCVAATLTPSNDRARRVHIFIAVWIVYFVNLIYFIIISVFTFNVSVSIFLSLSVGRTVGRPFRRMVASNASDSIFPFAFGWCLCPCARVREESFFLFESPIERWRTRKCIGADDTFGAHCAKTWQTYSIDYSFPFAAFVQCSPFCFSFLLFLCSRNGYNDSSQTHCTSTISRMHKLFSHNIVWKMDIPWFSFAPFGSVWFRSRLHRVSPRKMEIGGSIFLLVGTAHSDPFLLARRMFVERWMNTFSRVWHYCVCRRTQFIISCWENYWSMKKTIEFSFAVVMFFVMHFARLQQQLLTVYGLSLFAWLLTLGSLIILVQMPRRGFLLNVR